MVSTAAPLPAVLRIEGEASTSGGRQQAQVRVPLSLSNSPTPRRGRIKQATNLVRPLSVCFSRGITLALLLALVGAQTSASAESLADLSIEQLLKESVTSVSKKEQSLFDAAAAISVLTNDDLRRSGATTIPDALRLVPGLSVGAVSSREWAVSARGFNGLYSNKLLVLVDGRAVYNPIFSGVFWDVQQTMLEDVDRIEVIRGPGATVWGANAVNGVISVITQSARETQGGLLYGGGGDVHLAMGGARYGGRIGENSYYRIFSSYQSNDAYPLANGQSAEDAWQGYHGGFRLDHYPDSDTHLTWQADTSVADFDEGASSAYNLNTLGRWTRQLGERSNVEVQAYYDRTFRDELSRVRGSVDTFDLSAQHTFGLGAHHDMIWGLGYRVFESKLEPTSALLTVRNEKLGVQLFSAFVQDEFKVVPDKLTLTAGLKVEHNEYTGFEFQPSVRAVFKPTAQQTLWAAVSRAVRTPSALEGKDALGYVAGAPSPGPEGGLYVPTLTGTGDPSSEVLWAYELGYRVQPARRVSVDVAAFYNDYSDLIGNGAGGRYVSGTPLGTLEIPFANILSAESYGGEAAITVAPVESLRFTASYSLLFLQVHGSAARSTPIEKSAPMHQVSLRSAYDFTKRASLDMQLRYVDGLESVPGYVTADVRLSYRPTDRLELSLVGQNLFARQHLEQGVTPATIVSEVPRGVFGKISWKF